MCDVSQRYDNILRYIMIKIHKMAFLLTLWEHFGNFQVSAKADL